MRYGYTRVSTTSRNTKYQEEILQKHNCDKIYSEKHSGSELKGRILKKILEQLVEGDVIVVTDIDRLSRSVRDIIKIIDEVKDKKASIEILSHNISIDNNTSPQQMLTIYILAAYAEYDICRFHEKVNHRLPKKGYKQRKPKVLNNSTIIRICYISSMGYSAKGISDLTKIRYNTVRRALEYKAWFTENGVKEILEYAIESKKITFENLEFDLIDNLSENIIVDMVAK
jgi:DNA invertase Pin-like site-specific DNA recombinase